MLVSFDCESLPLPPQGTSKVCLRPVDPELVCVTWQKEDSAAQLAMWDDLDPFIEVLKIPEVILVAHSIAFDLRCLSLASEELATTLRCFVDEGRVLDTRVQFLLRDPDPKSKRVSLDFLTCKYLHKSLSGKGSTQLSYRRGIPLTAEQKRYALEDAEVTLKIAKKLQSLPYGSEGITLASQHHVHCAPTEGLESPDVLYSRAAAYMAFELGPRGLEIDQPKLAYHHGNLSKKVDQLRGELYNRGFAKAGRAPKSEIRIEHGKHSGAFASKWHLWREYNNAHRVVRSRRACVETAPAKITLDNKKLRALALEEEKRLELNIPRSEKTAKISLERDSWKDYRAELDPVMRTFLDYQKASKYLSSFTAPLSEAHASRIYANYFIPGAATGRWSSSKPNLQQVPRDLRNLYRPRDGHVFVAADYPSLELYTLAHCMAQMGIKGPMMEMLESDTDPHSWTAEKMSVDRFAAKQCNFGLAGGMGPVTFLKTVKGFSKDPLPEHWNVDYCRELKRKWLATFPDVDLYLRSMKADPWQLAPVGSREKWLRGAGISEGECVSTWDLTLALDGGRIYTVHLPSKRVIPRRTFPAAANAFFQGTGSETITAAFNKACLLKLPVCGVVHDSIMLESMEAEAASHQQCLGVVMQGALRYICPTVPIPPIEVKIMERWQ